jgi:dipeptidyl aminopeptidase/acylaminoacyl peptidase
MVAFTDSRISESSGLATSSDPAVLWTLNDEPAKPHAFGVNTGTGDTVATFSLAGASLHDPEAIFRDHLRRLWYFDTGDNDSDRPYVRVFVLGEPAPNGNHGDLGHTMYKLSYPGGARNAEAGFVQPTTNTAYIISKEASSKLYSLPAKIYTDRVNPLTLVHSSMGADVSDASITPDGRFLLSRRQDENTTVYVQRTSDWGFETPVTVPSQTKPEGIAVATDQLSFWISSEGSHAPLYQVSMPTAYRPAAAVPPPKPPSFPASPCG